MKAVSGAVLLVLVCASLAAQTSKNPISTKPEGATPNCSYTGSVSDGKSTSSSACTPGAMPGTDPNLIAPATQRFPFPGAAPSLPATPVAPAAPANPGSEPATSPADSVATPTAPGQSATQRFPFPGSAAPNDGPAPARSSSDQDRSPQGSTSSPLRDAGSSGSSSSSGGASSSSSSGKADPAYSSSGAGSDNPNLPDDDPNAPLPTPRHTRKKLVKEKPALSADEQEAEDVQVAGFYRNDGNFLAAYQRAKEAVGLVADDPAAHLALADAARKLGKLDEAKTHYTKVLALDPVPKVRKPAEKALKEMSGS